MLPENPAVGFPDGRSASVPSAAERTGVDVRYGLSERRFASVPFAADERR